MKQFYILGRNPELSKQEIYAYLEGRNINYKEILHKKEILILETETTIDIQELGGTMHSGNIEYEGTKLHTYLEGKDIPPSEKFSYSTFGEGNRDILGETFKQQKKKGMYKPGTKRLELQGGEEIPFSETDYTFLLHQEEETTYFGTVTQTFNHEYMIQRDMEKPIRREELAISPRLSRILINLTGTKQGELLGDPFCGIGAILLEGITLGINVYGRDKDKQATKAAKQNLHWYTQKNRTKTTYEIEEGNSKEFPEKNFDGIAGEGPLGQLLTHKASKKEAKHMIEQYETTIIPILQRLKECTKKDGKIALTMPVIGEQKVNKEKILEETNLQLAHEPIQEYRKKQYVSREIYTFKT